MSEPAKLTRGTRVDGLVFWAYSKGRPRFLSEAEFVRRKALSRAAVRRFYARNREAMKLRVRLSRRTPEGRRKAAARMRAYRARYPEKFREMEVRRRDKKRENNRRWSAKNRDHFRRKRVDNIQWRLGCVLRCRLRHAVRSLIRRKRSAAPASPSGALSLIGCSLSELKLHLERQFQPGMNWSNYGNTVTGGERKWNIDHLAPCAAFDLSDPEQRRACFHWSNLRPLWSSENCSKGARIIHLPR